MEDEGKETKNGKEEGIRKWERQKNQTGKEAREEQEE